MWCTRPVALILTAVLFVGSNQSSPAQSATIFYEQGRHWQYSVGDEQRALQYYLQAWAALQEEGGAVSAAFDVAGMMNDLGILTLNSGNIRQAIGAFEYALEVNPVLPSALSNLAGILVDIGQPHEAVSLYSKAIAVDPVNSALYHNLGYCYHSLGDEPMAISWWRKALDLNPDQRQTRCDLAMALCSEGLIAESQHNFDRALSSVANTCRTYDECDSLYWIILFQRSLGIVPVIQYGEQEDNLRTRLLFIQSALHVSREFPANSITDPLSTVGCSSMGYYLLYQGWGNLLPRRVLADAYWHVSSSTLRYVAPFLVPRVTGLELISPSPAHMGNVGAGSTSTTGTDKDTSARVRVGFLSSFFYRHSVGLLLGGVIKKLNRSAAVV